MERSSNYIVGKDGKVVQMVDIREKAWCQGLPQDAIQRAKLPAVVERNVNPNFYCISIEHEGVYKETHGKLTDAQLAATIELTRHILSEVKEYFGTDIPVDRQHLVGHCVIDPVNRSYCPGELFPFDEVISALKEKK